MVHEIAFYSDTNCSLRIRSLVGLSVLRDLFNFGPCSMSGEISRSQLRTLESGHRASFKPSHALDLLAASPVWIRKTSVCSTVR